MAEALLRDRLRRRGVDGHVHSAGLLDAGQPPSPHGVTVMQTMGLDLSGHRSRTMNSELLTSADLVLGMARLHVREAVVFVPSIWPRAFTLKELVRRATEVGPRTMGQPFDEWLAKCHAGRAHADLLGDTLEDDVDDPIGTSRANYERTAAELRDLVDRLVDIAFPPSPIEAGATP
jgi:protein-tyrosine-phosphatase